MSSRRLLALLAAVAVLAACGVPGGSKPHPIDPQVVPFQLLAPTTGATSTTIPSAMVTTRITIYLADADGHLVATNREVSFPATPTKVINALLLGPAPGETDRLHSAITSGTNLRQLHGPKDGLVTIDLSRDLLGITGRQQILALAQVVYTVTSMLTVDRVLFQFDGQAHEVPNGDGKLTTLPLDRLSYLALLGR